MTLALSSLQAFDSCTELVTELVTEDFSPIIIKDLQGPIEQMEEAKGELVSMMKDLQAQWDEEFENGLLRSIPAIRDCDAKESLWPAPFADGAALNYALELPEPTRAQLLMQAAEQTKTRLECNKMALALKVDALQRALVSFNSEWSQAPAVSMTESKYTRFEFNLFRGFKEIDAKVAALRAFVTPVRSEIPQVDALLSDATMHYDKACCGLLSCPL